MGNNPIPPPRRRRLTETLRTRYVNGQLTVEEFEAAIEAALRAGDPFDPPAPPRPPREPDPQILRR